MKSLPMLILIGLALSGCARLGLPGFVEKFTPTPPGGARALATTRPMPPTSTAPAPEPSATPAVALAENGPWLTYLADSKIGSEVVAANPDGSGRTVVGALSDVFVPLFGRPTAPGAGWFSLQNGRDQSLTLFQLPQGAAQKGFALLSNKDLSDDQKRAYATILNQKAPASQAWSPDGRLLAFIGAMDGAFSDLYVFNSGDGSLTRLTEKTGEAFYPSWSPDGKWVIVQEIQMASGAGKVSAVYAFTPDGASFRTLYKPASLGEQVFGWTAPDTFMVASRRQLGLVEERRYNIEQKKPVQLQYSGPIDQGALNPDKAVLAFTVAPKDKEAPSLPAGLYWTSPATGPVNVEKGKWQRLAWSAGAARFFAAYPGGVLSFAPGEEKLRFEGEDNLPEASPDGKLLAFYAAESGSKPGLRFYAADGKLEREVTSEPVQEALWRQDGSGLFYVSAGDLYYTAIPGGEPKAIDQGVSNLGWVGAKN